MATESFQCCILFKPELRAQKFGVKTDFKITPAHNTVHYV